MDFSATLTLITTLSGALPCSVLTSTFSKKPRLRSRCCERRSKRGVERVALGEPELAPDDLVQGAHVAADVDPLDIDLADPR